MILKFQRPLASSKADPPVLVCDKSRVFARLVPFADYQHFFEFVDKFYAKCLVRNGAIVIRKVIEDQGW
jgi:hypothetical protein